MLLVYSSSIVVALMIMSRPVIGADATPFLCSGYYSVPLCSETTEAYNPTAPVLGKLLLLSTIRNWDPQSYVDEGTYITNATHRRLRSIALLRDTVVPKCRHPKHVIMVVTNITAAQYTHMTIPTPTDAVLLIFRVSKCVNHLFTQQTTRIAGHCIFLMIRKTRYHKLINLFYVAGHTTGWITQCQWPSI
jgi:hypothetical protein